MVIPERRAPIGDAPQLRLAARREVARIVENGGAPARAVERVEIFRDTLADLAKDRNVAGEHRNPEGQRFDQREAEAFGKGRQQQCPRVLKEAGGLAVGECRPFRHEPGQRRAAVEHVDRGLDFPAAPPDQQQGGRGVAVAGEIAPQIEQQQMVFARLDCPEAHKIGPLRQCRPGRRDRRRIDPELRRQQPTAARRAREVRRQRRTGCRRRDDQHVGEGGGVLDSLAVPLTLTGTGEFGKLAWDQIVNEADKRGAVPALQRGEQATVFKAMVRHQQINRALGRGPQAPAERAPAPDARKPQTQRRPSHPCPAADAGSFTPQRGDRLDIALDQRPRQQRQTTAAGGARKTQAPRAGDQVPSVGELDTVDAGRRRLPGARDQARNVEYDHRGLA